LKTECRKLLSALGMSMISKTEASGDDALVKSGQPWLTGKKTLLWKQNREKECQ